MRIIVIGGSGRTGILIVKQLIAAKHPVVGTIRNPRHMVDRVKLGAEAAQVKRSSLARRMRETSTAAVPVSSPAASTSFTLPLAGRAAQLVSAAN